MIRPTLILSLVLLLPAILIGADVPNLFPEGSFAAGIQGWSGRHGPWELRAFKPQVEGELRFVRIDQPGSIIDVAKPMQEAWNGRTMVLNLQSRRAGIQPGNAPHEVPSAELNFKDAAGKDLLNWRRSIFMPTNTTGWETVTREYEVPAGAATVILTIGSRAQAGTADFANITVVLK